jgi:hypothetical protein
MRHGTQSIFLIENIREHLIPSLGKIFDVAPAPATSVPAHSLIKTFTLSKSLKKGLEAAELFHRSLCILNSSKCEWKSYKLVLFCVIFQKSFPDEYQGRNRSRIALRLRLYQNDPSPAPQNCS